MHDFQEPRGKVGAERTIKSIKLWIITQFYCSFCYAAFHWSLFTVAISRACDLRNLFETEFGSLRYLRFPNWERGYFDIFHNVDKVNSRRVACYARHGYSRLDTCSVPHPLSEQVSIRVPPIDAAISIYTPGFTGALIPPSDSRFVHLPRGFCEQSLMFHTLSFSQASIGCSSLRFQ